MNGPKNTYDRSIELVDVTSGKLTHNVTKHLGDGDYAWMPDGRSFVFVRTVEKQKPQLYRYTLATGAIVQLTHIKEGVSAPVVSHAGDRIALAVTDSDPAHDAYVDFAKAGFTPKSSQKKSDIAIIDDAVLRDERPGLHVSRPSAHLDDRCRRLAPEAADFGQVLGELRRVVARRSHDSVRLVALRVGRRRPERRLHDSVCGWHDAESRLAAAGATAVSSSARDGSRVYFLSGDVKDAAELPALVVGEPRRLRSRASSSRATRFRWGDTLLADMKEGGGFCGWPLPGGKRALLNIDGPGYANLRTLDLDERRVRGRHAAEGRSLVVLGLARRDARRLSV